MRQSVTFFDVLMRHAALYPTMEAQDYVKLAYQSEFGCGHLLSDRDAAYRALLDELDAIRPDAGESLTVPICGGFARLNLAAAKRVLPPDLIFAMMTRSMGPAGDRASFDRKIARISRAADMGLIPAAGEAIRPCAAALGDGIPSHSARFRREYRPHYRVMSEETALLAPLCVLLCDAAKKTDLVNVGIDGPAASGKSTAASALAELLDATVIRLDDYFLPAAGKTPERLAVPGGNIDAERFTAEILCHDRAETLTHAAFSCRNQTLLPPVTEIRKPFLIVEGVYALRSDFRSHYDVRLFFDVDREEQRERLRERESDGSFARYEAEWLPLEEAYFAAEVPRLCADMVIIT